MAMKHMILSMLENVGTIPIYSMLHNSNKLGASSNAAFIDLSRLATHSNVARLPIIEYAYDPLPAPPIYPNQQPLRLPNGSTVKPSCLHHNAAKLDPISAGFPYRCSINFAHANKFWQSNLDETVKLLTLFAEDGSASDIEVDHGITLANLARKALRPGLEHQIVLATHYMYPGANEYRVKLIAALMIFYFVFDDKIEETPDNTLPVILEDFLRHLEGKPRLDSTPSALQSHMHEIVNGVESEDAASGDGGRDLIETLRDAFRCVHPHLKGFQNVDEYLHFRRFNVGAAFVIAGAKFSVESSVSVTDPRFARYLSLIGDHLGLVNDLASYDKELRALNSGETSDMINVVAVVKSVTSLQSTDEAKRVVWALQLQIEKHMIEELEGLQAQGLSDEEWWFLEAVLAAATGNVMYCMTSSRYGGETARIGSGSNRTRVACHTS